MDFFQTQLDFLNLISGVALFVVAASFTVIMRLQPDRNYWRWLVGFASFFALRQWGRMMLSGLDDSPNFIVLRTILLATSLLFLLEFARRANQAGGKMLPRITWLAMLVAASSGGLLGLASFNTTMRVSFLILGSIWAAAGLWRSGSATRAEKFLALSLGCFGLIAGSSGPRSNLFPGNFLNSSYFLLLTGFPIEILLVPASLILAAAAYYCSTSIGRKHDHSSLGADSTCWELSCAAVLTVWLAGGWVITAELGKEADELKRSEIIISTRIVAAALDPTLVRQLSGKVEDIESEAHSKVRARLIELGNLIPRARYVYLMGAKDGEVVYFADTSPDRYAAVETDEDETGEVYAESSDELRAAVVDGHAFVEGPVTDSWGVWISALVPVKDPETGQLLCLLGIDYEADQWQRDIFAHRLPGIAVSAVISIILVLFVVILRWQQQLATAAHAITAAALQNTQLELAVTEGKYRNIVENVSDLILVTTAHGVITYANPRIEQFGYSRDEILALPVHTFVLPDDVAIVEDTLARIKEGAEVFQLRHRILTKSGEIRWVESQGRVVKDSKGVALCLMTATRDITERVEADDLRRAKEAAEMASEAKSQFLANVSHEIRTSMNAIIGFTDLLARSSLEQKQHDHLEIVRGAAKRLLALMDNILDLSKLEAGRLEITKSAFSVEALVEEVRTLFEARAGQQKIELLLKVMTDGDYLLLSDEMRLRQILINLLSNALKFTKHGSVTVALQKRRKAPTLAEVTIEVIDTGIGIPEKLVPFIFDKFWQADSSCTKHYTGTGLGLAISKQLAEMMGYTISYCKGEPAGSIFKLAGSLPIVEDDAAVDFTL